MEFGLGEMHEPEAKPAGSSRTGAIGDVFGLGNFYESGEEFFQLLLIFQSSSFLSAEDRGGAFGTNKRIENITGNIDGRKFRELIAIDRVEIFKTAGERGEGPSGAEMDLAAGLRKRRAF